jgi:hypothetical protein
MLPQAVKSELMDQFETLETTAAFDMATLDQIEADMGAVINPDYLNIVDSVCGFTPPPSPTPTYAAPSQQKFQLVQSVHIVPTWLPAAITTPLATGHQQQVTTFSDIYKEPLTPPESPKLILNVPYGFGVAAPKVSPFPSSNTNTARTVAGSNKRKIEVTGSAQYPIDLALATGGTGTTTNPSFVQASDFKVDEMSWKRSCTLIAQLGCNAYDTPMTSMY